MLLGMLSYFFIFALLTGGMNLAIDSTAGERERGSLEPLLCLPVTRDQLIFGKIFAACCFMALSLSLSLLSFFITLKFVPLQKLGMTPNFGPTVVLTAFFLLVPFALLGAALMTLVASFTKSLQGSANLAQRSPSRTDPADPHRQHPDGATEHRTHGHPVTQPAPAAGQPAEK